ncbi:MAG TPA: ThuA domain-containing protein [Acidimicrobiales bacterium]|nr:ThuA domain-containing protein [Acidimicrobiales bacterium]
MASGRMLVLTEVAPYEHGPAGVHGVLTQATVALCELGSMAGLEPRHLATTEDLGIDDIEAGGVLALFTIGETPFTPAQKEALGAAWRDGRLGLLGVHSASDASHTWPEYGTMLGGRFDGHPWTQSLDIDVVDRSHPATEHLGPTWAWHDELYLFKDLRPDAHVLLRLSPDQDLDMSVAEARTPPSGFPLAWCHRDGKAATFYSALGHFPLAWETPTHLRYLAGGLRWLLESTG